MSDSSVAKPWPKTFTEFKIAEGPNAFGIFVYRLFKRRPTPSPLASETALKLVIYEQNNNLDLVHACMGNSGEAAEIGDLIKKHVFNGHPLDREKLLKEMGDQFFYFQVLLNLMGWDLAMVQESNYVKLTSRYHTGEYSDAQSIARADTHDHNRATDPQ